MYLSTRVQAALEQEGLYRYVAALPSCGQMLTAHSFKAQFSFSVWVSFSFRASEMSSWTRSTKGHSDLQQDGQKRELLAYLCFQGSLSGRCVL